MDKAQEKMFYTYNDDMPYKASIDITIRNMHVRKIKGNDDDVLLWSRDGKYKTQIPKSILSTECRERITRYCP